MSPRLKSALLLGGVLALGMLIGALLSGAAFNRRLATIAESRTSRGMAFVLERVVRPESEEQRRAFRDIVEGTASDYASVFERTGAELRALNDTVMARVRPLLSPEQTERLDDYLRMRQDGRLGRRRRGPGDGRRERSGPPPRWGEEPPPDP